MKKTWPVVVAWSGLIVGLMVMALAAMSVNSPASTSPGTVMFFGSGPDLSVMFFVISLLIIIISGLFIISLRKKQVKK